MNGHQQSRIAAARNALGQGRFDDAAKIAASLLLQDPALVEAIEVLFVCAQSQGELSQAELLLRRAIEVAPDRRWPYGDLARLLLDQGKAFEAETVARQALQSDSANADALMLLASMELQRGLLIEAEEHAQAAIALVGRHRQLLTVLGRSLLLQSRIDEAREILMEAGGLAPSLEVYAALAELDERAGRLDAASVWLDQAEQAAKTRGGDVALQRATLLGRMGQHHAALALLESHSDLSGGALLQRGRLHDLVGDRARAWSDWTAGKAALARKHGRVYATAEVEREAKAFRTLAERVDWQADGATDDVAARRPIFILGFPRSGTTLVEQIVATHSAIMAGGELPFGPEMRELAVVSLGGENRFIRWLEQGDIEAAALFTLLREHYFARADAYRLLGTGGLQFTDKMPLNELWLPLIRLTLPEARLVRVVRHPLDVVVSMLSHDMTHGQNCGYRVDDIVTHMLLMHGQIECYAAAGLRIDHTIRYEALVADQHGETRRMMGALGLAMEPAQMEFHATRRIAPTPSYAQVQEPLNTRSIGRWRSFKMQLGPAMAQLEPVIFDLGYDLT